MALDSNIAELERLDRYLTGAQTSAERGEFERQLAADPRLTALVRAIQGFGRPPEWNRAAAWADVQRQLADGGGGERRLRIMRVSGERAIRPWSARNPRVNIPLAAAAAFVMAAGAGALFMNGRSLTGASRNTGSAPPQPRQIATRRGERAMLRLTDGSRVILGPESRLVIPAGFERKGPGVRQAFLEGEAYFEIKHDEHRTLRVVTSTVITEDLGTSFLVIAYPASRATRVIVESGSVALGLPTRQRAFAGAEPLAVLHAGDLARVDTAGVATVSHVNAASYVAWTTGTIVFDATALRDAVRELERWYDLDIRIANEALAERRLSGSFRNAADDEMLRELAEALGIRVIRHGRAVLLAPPTPTLSDAPVPAR
jgi:ferric-dicitrate binding protein FerR (iron transport regulator)